MERFRVIVEAQHSHLNTLVQDSVGQCSLKSYT